jgi:hypothetical protein
MPKPDRYRRRAASFAKLARLAPSEHEMQMLLRVERSLLALADGESWQEGMKTTLVPDFPTEADRMSD